MAEHDSENHARTLGDPRTPGGPTGRAALRAPVLVRALPALGVGLGITFTADHSSRLGLLALGILGLASALALIVGALRLPRGEALRDLHLGLGVVYAIAGAVALLLPGTRLSFLLLVLAGWSVISGALELVWGIRRRTDHPFGRDALIVGGGTLALAVVLGLTSDPVSAVGFLGAYAVVVGVFLVIAALSLTRGPSQKEQHAS